MKEHEVAATFAFEADVGFAGRAGHRANVLLNRFAERCFTASAVIVGLAHVVVAERRASTEAVSAVVVALVAAITVVRARAAARAVARRAIGQMAQRVLTVGSTR